MKILIAHNYYRTPGGEDAVFKSECELLKSFGEEVILYERANAELDDLSDLRKFKYLFSLGYSKKTYNEIRALIKKFRPDAAHFHNIFFLITPAAYFACKDEGVPVVQSQHNFRLLCSNALFYRNNKPCEDCLRKSLWEGVRHKCYRNSRVLTGFAAWAIDLHWKKNTWMNKVDMYITAADFTRQKYLQRGIPKEKISIKPHFLSKDPGQRSGHKNYVLYVGRLSQEKGVDVLIRAWEALKHIPLKIIGNGEQGSQLRELAKHNSDIEFLGRLPEEECERYLREACLLVIPSVCYESFPRILVEAYAHGLPVVASRLGSLAELIIDGKTGLLFEPGEAQDLAEKVRFLLEDEPKRLAMGTEVRLEYEGKYTPQENYKQLVTIYKQAIEVARNS